MENLSGTLVKGYELQERIGSGGFGAVYKAKQTTVGREVAIKIILPGLANRPDFIRRFETEAQLIARLEHPFIVPLFDYWRDPNGAYLVMRWLRGGSLRDALQQGAFDLTTAATLMDQITGALSAAHRHGVIHRDLKPGNILLDEDSNAYLADFGIAKDIGVAGSEEVTEPDQIIGSPDYLAPEQARSEPVTPRTDIYSLGVVLYELLTGQHPFPNITGVERLFKHLNAPLPVITSLDPTCRDDLNDVIQTATQKDPARRFADVLEMAAAFRKAIAARHEPAESEIVELLTLREQEILQGIIDGLANNQIAEKLFVELSTVKWYIKQIYKKLGVRSRVQAIVRARELDLIVPGPDNGHPTVIGGTTSTTRLPAPENPYKGLRAFQPADELDFFGREKLTKKIIQRLNEKNEWSRFLAIVGPSGSGKSSLVNAGLIPALWRGELPGSERWFVVEMLPGTHPLDELEVALMRIAADQSGHLNEQLRRDERGLVRASQLILPNDGSELVLIVDQFEEAFTLTENDAERQQFLDLLHAAVTEKRSRVRVVVTLRADFYDRPLMYPQFGELVRNRMETVLPLSAKELESAIVNPAKRVGVTFEEGLVATIVSEINYQPGALPLLQYALTELFEQRDHRTLTLAAYQKIGGIVGALAQRAEELYNELNADGQAIARQIFLRLVTLGEGVEDTRRRTPRAELAALTPYEDLLNDIIDMFAEYRLLSLDHDPATRAPTVEVAHEALLREWERLRNWLNESRSDVRMQRQLALMSGEWRAAQQDHSFLLRGSRLEMLEGWMAGTGLAITPQEREFLDASLAERAQQEAARRAQEAREIGLRQRAQRILQALVVVLLVAAVVAGGLALWANGQRSRAEDEKARAESAEQEALRHASIGLAAQAVAELEGDTPERGVLLALAALENYPYTAQAERALAQTVYETHRYTVLSSPDYWVAVNNVAFSADGTRIATVGGERIIGIWDCVSGDLLTTFNRSETDPRGEEGIWGVDWSSDGRILVTSSVMLNMARVWDVESGELLLGYEGHDGPVHTAYFSGDARFVLTASADGTAHIWERDTGTAVRVFEGHTDAVTDAVWSPDDTQIVTASADGTIRRWDVSTGEELQVINAHTGGALAVAWSPDGQYVASAGKDGLGRVWNIGTGTAHFTLIGHDNWVRDIEWSPDGAYLATSSSDGTARIWEAIAGSEMVVFSLSGGDITHLAWSPDGHQLAWANAISPRVWDVTTPIVRLVGHGTDVQGQAVIGTPTWSSDSALMLTTGWPDATVRIWNSQTGAELTHYEQTEGPREMMLSALHPSRSEVLMPAPLRIWNYETGEIRVFTDDFPQEALGFWSPDGRLVYIKPFGSPEYGVYDAETGERLLLSTLENCAFGLPGAWSPDSHYLSHPCLSEGPGSLVVTEALTGNVVHEYHGHTDGVQVAYWSPDGTRLVTSSPDHTARVWDFETGEVITIFSGHTDWVFSAGWSPDSTRIVSGDVAGNVRIWDADTGQEVNSYHVAGRITEVHWSPDGTRVVAAGQFAVPEIRPVWQSTDELIAYAHECCVFRSLTSEERELFGLALREP